jgi:hypothetical protein
VTVRSFDRLLARFSNARHGNNAQDLRDLVESAYPVVIAKSVGQTVTSSTTLQDDNELTFDIDANEVWVIRYVLFPVSDSPDPDIKAALGVPAGAVGNMTMFGADLPATTVSSPLRSQVRINDFANQLNTGVTDASDRPSYFDAAVINGANSGAITLRWAQNTSNANGVTLSAGSFLIAHQANT